MKRLVLLTVLAACGGNAKTDSSTPANTTPDQPASASGQHKILDAVLASTHALPAETHRDDECGGAPTLGALVKEQLARFKEPIVDKCVPFSDDTFQCYAFIGPENANPDPTDPNYKVTGFSVAWVAKHDDGTGFVEDGLLECRWM